MFGKRKERKRTLGKGEKWAKREASRARKREGNKESKILFTKLYGQNQKVASNEQLITRYFIHNFDGLITNSRDENFIN